MKSLGNPFQLLLKPSKSPSNFPETSQKPQGPKQPSGPRELFRNHFETPKKIFSLIWLICNRSFKISTTGETVQNRSTLGPDLGSRHPLQVFYNGTYFYPHGVHKLKKAKRGKIVHKLGLGFNERIKFARIGRESSKRAQKKGL